MENQTNKPTGKQTLAGLMGGVALATALLSSLTGFEGKRNVGYLDVAKVPTACMGDTADVIVGHYYSDAECSARLERQAIVHVAEVKACTPGIGGNQLLAAGLLAYNIGGPAYCSSSIARQFNAGQLRAACNGFPAWKIAGGKVVQGLVTRRAAEQAICLRGLPA
jgi:lysozyme